MKNEKELAIEKILEIAKKHLLAQRQCIITQLVYDAWELEVVLKVGESPESFKDDEFLDDWEEEMEAMEEDEEFLPVYLWYVIGYNE